jgi:EpsI family protein
MKIARITWCLAVTLVLAIVGAHLLRPTQETRHLGDKTLEDTIPKSFGDWTTRPLSLIHVDLTEAKAISDPTKGDRPTYDEILSRTYVNSAGQVIMLSLAYGRRQSQELRIHRPELCYTAQGYEVTDLGISDVMLAPGVKSAAKTLMTSSRGRIEPVTYWIRIGNRITIDPWKTRGEVLRQGLQGYVPDGMLVRVSSLVSDAGKANDGFELQKRFIADFYQALDADSKYLIAAR